MVSAPRTNEAFPLACRLCASPGTPLCQDCRTKELLDIRSSLGWRIARLWPSLSAQDREELISAGTVWAVNQQRKWRQVGSVTFARLAPFALCRPNGCVGHLAKNLLERQGQAVEGLSGLIAPTPSGWDDDDWRAILTRLPEEQARMVSLCYREGHTVSDAAKLLGLTRLQGWRLRQKALLALKASMQADGP